MRHDFDVKVEKIDNGRNELRKIESNSGTENGSDEEKKTERREEENGSITEGDDDNGGWFEEEEEKVMSGAVEKTNRVSKKKTSQLPLMSPNTHKSPLSSKYSFVKRKPNYI